MKSMTIFAVLTLGITVWTEEASAQEYNLRTIPPTPQAGAPFVAAFESTDCEAWVLPPLGQPPVVTVQGSTVSLEVDRITIANCSYPVQTNTLSVPALPVGSYQLELIARAYQSPGNDIFAQATIFQVGQAVVMSAVAIPASGHKLLAILAAMVLGLGCLMSRMRE